MPVKWHLYAVPACQPATTGHPRPPQALDPHYCFIYYSTPCQLLARGGKRKTSHKSAAKAGQERAESSLALDVRADSQKRQGSSSLGASSSGNNQEGHGTAPPSITCALMTWAVHRENGLPGKCTHRPPSAIPAPPCHWHGHGTPSWRRGRHAIQLQLPSTATAKTGTYL